MNLLKEGIEQKVVIKTDRAKKMVVDGLSSTYPIYQVRIDYLFYNDKNDRIATWISEYETKNGHKLIIGEDFEEYNKMIQKFITESNSDKLKNTQQNIRLVGQQECGVILTDGRVIDGNRRFTCLRNLSKEFDGFNYFETVILDKDYENDEKQIKMLELQLQHGKEERVDYDPIEKLVGLYRDVVVNKLLTVNEYARGVNKKERLVEEDLEVAMLMVEFLETINAPGKFYLARELKLDGPLRELQKILKKINNEDKKEDIKNIAFTNMLTCPSKDLTRFIRKLSTISTSKYVDEFIEEEIEMAEKVIDSLPSEGNVNGESISELRSNDKLQEDLNNTMEKYENRAKVSKTKNKPVQFLKKAIDNVGSIDVEIIKRLSCSEKDNLVDALSELEEAIKLIRDELYV